MHRPVTELHAQGNAMAERMVKMIHTAILDDKDPRREVYMMMMTHNDTPHSATGETPPETLMKRFQRTNLPSLPAKTYSEDKMVRERDFNKMKKPKTRRLRLGTRSWWLSARPQPRPFGTQLLTRWWTSLTGGPPSEEGGATCR